MYIAESCENLKHLLPANLVQTGSVQLCQFATQSQFYHTQYMFLTNADDLLCLQLHTVRSPYTVHAVPTAADSPNSTTHSTCF